LIFDSALPPEFSPPAPPPYAVTLLNTLLFPCAEIAAPPPIVTVYVPEDKLELEAVTTPPPPPPPLLLALPPPATMR
jgi:hypothetical protein